MSGYHSTHELGMRLEEVRFLREERDRLISALSSYQTRNQYSLSLEEVENLMKHARADRSDPVLAILKQYLYDRSAGELNTPT